MQFAYLCLPSGTSDEHISLLEYLRAFNPSAILVTTPQAVSLADNLRSLDFTRKTGLPLLGLVENMSGYVCPHCTECTNVWGRGGGQALAEKEGIQFLGRIPIDPGLVRVLDDAKDEAVHIATTNMCSLGIDQPLAEGTDVTESSTDVHAATSPGKQSDSAQPSGTLLSQTVLRRYRASQTFPIFQEITRQVVRLAHDQAHASEQEALAAHDGTAA